MIKTEDYELSIKALEQLMILKPSQESDVGKMLEALSILIEEYEEKALHATNN